MAKAYWVSCYHSISDPAARAEYAKLAGPALRAAGGRYIALGRPAKVYEAGIDLPVFHQRALQTSGFASHGNTKPRWLLSAIRQ